MGNETPQKRESPVRPDELKETPRAPTGDTSEKGRENVGDAMLGLARFEELTRDDTAIEQGVARLKREALGLPGNASDTALRAEEEALRAVSDHFGSALGEYSLDTPEGRRQASILTANTVSGFENRNPPPLLSEMWTAIQRAS